MYMYFKITPLSENAFESRHPCLGQLFQVNFISMTETIQLTVVSLS